MSHRWHCSRLHLTAIVLCLLGGRARAEEADPDLAPATDAFVGRVDRLIAVVRGNLNGGPSLEERARSTAALIALHAKYGEGGGGVVTRATLFKHAIGLTQTPLAAGVTDLVNRKADRTASMEVGELLRGLRYSTRPVSVHWFQSARAGGLGIWERLAEPARKGKDLQARDLDDSLLEAALHTAVIADFDLAREAPLVLESFSPLWHQLGQDMRTGSYDLAAAVRARDVPAAAQALGKVRTACTSFHQQFLVTLPAEHVLKTLADPKQPLSARIPAAGCLTRLGGPIALRHDPEESKRLQEELDARRHEVLPHVFAVLKEPNPDLRADVVSALRFNGCYGTSRVAGLDAILEKAEPYPRHWIAYQLRAAKNSEQAVPVLCAALTHPDKEVARLAVELLGRIRSANVVTVPTPQEMDSADAAMQALLRSLQDTDAIVRGRAAIVLAGQGQPAVAGLIEVVQGDQRDARAAAAFSLGKIGLAARAALPALRELQRNDDKILQLAAGQALKKIEPAPPKEPKP